MKQEILGEITRNGDDGLATIRHGGRDIQIEILPDDEPFETTLKLAVEVVARLDELDKLARRVVSVKLRDTDNDGWNEYDEAQEDGSLKAIINPQLSEAEFEAKLSVDSIIVAGDQHITFFYDDSGMFWGHCVMVSSEQGTDFSQAHAEMLG